MSLATALLLSLFGLVSRSPDRPGEDIETGFEGILPRRISGDPGGNELPHRRELSTSTEGDPDLGEANPPWLQEPPKAGKEESTWSGHLSYTAGLKVLSHSWDPAELQAEFGLFDLDLRPPGWPVWLVAQVLATYSSSVPHTLRDNAFFQNETLRSVGTYEVNLGVRELWEVGSDLDFFAGGGISLIGAAAQTYLKGQPEVTNHYTGQVGAGAWMSVGSYLGLGRLGNAQVHLGLELQFSWGEVSLLNQRVNAGGFHALLMFGVHW
jgi:hypothetical protein